MKTTGLVLFLWSVSCFGSSKDFGFTQLDDSENIALSALLKTSKQTGYQVLTLDEDEEQKNPGTIKCGRIKVDAGVIVNLNTSVTALTNQLRYEDWHWLLEQEKMLGCCCKTMSTIAIIASGMAMAAQYAAGNENRALLTDVFVTTVFLAHLGMRRFENSVSKTVLMRIKKLSEEVAFMKDLLAPSASKADKKIYGMHVSDEMEEV